MNRQPDPRIYWKAGESILAGEIPYRDFFIEYPPGSFVAFVLPAIFTASREAYVAFFASQMALVLVATLVLTVYASRTLGRWWLLSAVVFAVAALLLHKHAVTRYDALVALSLAVAVALVGSTDLGRNSVARAATLAAWASLGFGAAVKLVPALAALPLAFLAGRIERARTFGQVARNAVPGLVVFFGAVAVFFLPAFLFGGKGFVKSFTYHAERGLQVESLAASVLAKLGWIDGGSVSYGAWHVRGRGVEFMSTMSPLVTLMLLVVTAAVIYQQHRKGRFGPGQFPQAAAACVLAFMLGSKVLSPQYMIWLLPLVPLSARGIWGIGASTVFLTSCWMTMQISLHYGGDIKNGLSPGIDILLARNLLLLVLWVLMLFLCYGGSKLVAQSVKPAIE